MRERRIPMTDQAEVTRLLQSAQSGNPQALNEALRHMYTALHGIARAQL
jgi:hypothetical protein